jgi:hypothetical protein
MRRLWVQAQLRGKINSQKYAFVMEILAINADVHVLSFASNCLHSRYDPSDSRLDGLASLHGVSAFVTGFANAGFVQ